MGGGQFRGHNRHTWLGRARGGIKFCIFPTTIVKLTSCGAVPRCRWVQVFSQSRSDDSSSPEWLQVWIYRVGTEPSARAVVRRSGLMFHVYNLWVSSDSSHCRRMWETSPFLHNPSIKTCSGTIRVNSFPASPSLTSLRCWRRSSRVARCNVVKQVQTVQLYSESDFSAICRTELTHPERYECRHNITHENTENWSEAENKVLRRYWPWLFYLREKYSRNHESGFWWIKCCENIHW